MIKKKHSKNLKNGKRFTSLENFEVLNNKDLRTVLILNQDMCGSTRTQLESQRVSRDSTERRNVDEFGDSSEIPRKESQSAAYTSHDSVERRRAVLSVMPAKKDSLMGSNRRDLHYSGVLLSCQQRLALGPV